VYDYEVTSGVIVCEREGCIQQRSYLNIAIVLSAMVQVLCLPNYPANSPFFYPSEYLPIGLIRNPGSAPHIPFVLSWVHAVPVISSYVSVLPMKSSKGY